MVESKKEEAALSPSSGVHEEYGEALERLAEALDVGQVAVGSGTRICDWTTNDDAVNMAATALGVKITGDDLVVDVCERILVLEQ